MYCTCVHDIFCTLTLDMWSSAYDCRTILLSIQRLLGEPNNESPLNSYAATLWSNQEDCKKMVHKQYMDNI
ncbi:hypothetical protein C4D60_Mb10t02100 [Musa balbisiana]|uniref:UBC core domain-containing protein n=1 Tax=Musa balbisiana TaxID=52838 RepID=A0A4S8IU17_MUSBA|nr:hypothetical protein C4D60_Mb10t02100 [Musa balbisiana]